MALLDADDARDMVEASLTGISVLLLACVARLLVSVISELGFLLVDALAALAAAAVDDAPLPCVRLGGGAFTGGLGFGAYVSLSGDRKRPRS